MGVIVNLTAAGSGTSSNASIRDHTVVVDRPVDKGGHDEGPMGGELLLAGVGGCFASNLLAAAAARDVDLGTVHITVDGEPAQSPARFERITMRVTSDTCPVDEFEHLVTVAERGCISANTLRRGVDLSIEQVSPVGQ